MGRLSTALLRHSQDWPLGHALQLMTAIALLLGAYLAISGLVRLSLRSAQPPATPAASQGVPDQPGPPGASSSMQAHPLMPC